MPRPEKVLYASFLRLLRRFRRDHIPLTGVVGSSVVVNPGQPINELRRLFRQPQEFSLQSGLRLLSTLQSQLQTLASSEEETREVLSEWEQLMARQAPDPSGANNPAAVALAAERGMQLLVAQSARLDELFSGGLLLGDEETAPMSQPSHGGHYNKDEGIGSRHEPVSLDSLAAEVLQRHQQLLTTDASLVLPPAARAAATAGPHVAGSHKVLLKAAALSEVLYGRHKFCHRPFEWVYEGLDPLLLPAVLARRRGAPLALAVLAAAVGRRAGLALTPVPAISQHPLTPRGSPLPSSESTGSSSHPGGSSIAPLGTGNLASQAAAHALEQLPVDLAAKVSGTLQGQGALPPLQLPWLLRVEGSQVVGAQNRQSVTVADSRSGEAGRVAACCYYLDAATGQLLSPEQAAEKYPGLVQIRPLHDPEIEALAVWQALVRTVIEAHQRRGESDLVAQWVYVLLALDPLAEEWQFMLQPG